MSLPALRRELKLLADPRKREVLSGFFKTGAGEYGEGDVFWGVTVPRIRALACRALELHETSLSRLLGSAVHEERLLALLILVKRFQQGRPEEQGRIYRFYLRHSRRVNNWDLVDLTADKIVGAFLFRKDKKRLSRLARSENLWERRIAIVSTFYFIRAGHFDPTLRISAKLLNDPHDLIHKASGWMLREVGKRDRVALERFLKKHYQRMPRTMLRYALERFPQSRRKAYLDGRI